MSYKNSNLYASRVFSEHPLALWAIDENFYFTSLIDESEKTINSVDWDIVNGEIVSSFVSPAENPIEGSGVAKVYLSSSSQYTLEMSLQDISYEDKIDTEKESVCLNFYAYVPDVSNIDSIESGFIVNGQEYLSSKIFSFVEYDRWIKIESTRSIDTEYDIKPIIKINYNESVVNDEENSSIFISGISVGQWSESFNSEDTGAVVTNVPTNIKNLIGEEYASLIYGVQLDPYGFNDSDSGYIIEYRKRLLAETSGIPMVYGSKNNVSILPRKSELTFSEFIDGGSFSSTYLEEIDGGSSSSSFTESIDGGPSFVEVTSPTIPSIVFPGKGFLNQSGKFSNLTVEFWARINNESVSPIKIFGPLTSQDGIYVGGEFITVKVGKYIKSYFIGQWYRPMLVHFGQSANEIFLMINGEKVISIQIDSLDISTFPIPSEDYLAFYGYQKLLPFDIDSFSIFPYVVTEQIAKLRFAYGQGAEDQEILSTTFGGDLTYVNFPYAGYNSTISFPDRTPWSNGYFNNLKVSSNGLSLPDHTLPDLLFTETSGTVSRGEAELIWQGFEEDNYLIQDEEYPFISLRPNANYEDINSTIFFSKMNKTSYPTKSVWGLIKTSDDVSTDQSLLFITSTNNTNVLEAKIVSGSLQYLYNGDVLSSSAVSTESITTVGFKIDKISEDYPQTRSFLSNTDLLSLNFAGSGSNMFLGKIFSLTLNNEFFTQKDAHIFDANGFAQNLSGQFDYIGAYTLLPKESNSTIFFDVAATGYWESSIPMSYFGKYVTNSNGQKVYDLDLIQFNIDIPNTIYSKETQDSIEYQTSSKARVYMTLQDVSSVGTIPYTDYVTTEVIGNDRVLDFNIASNTSTTKFEVCDSTVVFPPKELGSFSDYYLTTHILMTSSGVSSENMKIKNMSFSSASFDESAFYRINTPTGRSIYPITKSRDQYVYKRKNPVVIEKESGSYFYITGNSGIQVLSSQDGSLTKGISFPINETLKESFRFVGVQMYLMFNESDLFEEEKVFAKIFNNQKEYDLVLEPEAGGKRAFIKMINSETKQELSGVTFFLNGKNVSNVIVRPLRWNSLIISLQDNSLNLDQEIGQLEVYSGVRVNNVSMFSDINELRFNLVLSNDWGDIDNEAWNYYASSSWLEVLNEQNIPVTLLSVNGADVFDTYSGLSYAIGNDSATLSVNFDSIQVLNDANWTSFDIKPI